MLGSSTGEVERAEEVSPRMRHVLEDVSRLLP